MSIKSLLQTIGTSVPRYVTVDGRIVTEYSTSLPLSDLSPVAPHRFHGGATPVKAGASPPWWRNDEAKANDIADMRRAFRNLVVLDQDDDLAYAVEFNTGRGVVRCVLLPQFDQSLPRIFPVNPKRLGRRDARARGGFHLPPHVFTNGQLCIADEEAWNATERSTVVAGCWTAHWLACYTEWKIFGVWPTEGVDYLAAGFR